MKTSAVVLAAGRGKRMNSDKPKQYIELAGYPILYYTLRAFEESPVDEIILVCGKDEKEFCQDKIVSKYGFRKIRAITEGGKERYHSVYRGLLKCSTPDYVLIHDGARPFVTEKIMMDTIKGAEEGNGCVTGVPVTDTIKVIDQDGMVVETPERASLYAIHTPQTFPYSLIRSAYEKLIREENETGVPRKVTDDAMVLEVMLGKKVKVVTGSEQNIKVTTPKDLILAERILNDVR